MKKIKKKHPRAIRWMHWINFPVLFVMIWSGLLIYWANSVYGIGLGSFTLFNSFPDRFFNFLGLGHRLAEGMALHFFFMWFFALNGIAYVLYTAISGEWRYLLPDRHSFRDAIQVALHDLRLSKQHPPPRKFNGAQQIAYTSVILMGAGSLLTGLSIYRPVQFAWLTTWLGGYEWARWEHFWLAIGYVLFFLAHIAQVIRAGWNNFRAMITGYEIANIEPSSSNTIDGSENKQSGGSMSDNQTERKGGAELTDQVNRQPADSDSKSETRSADEAKALQPRADDRLAEQAVALDHVRAAESSADRAVVAEMRRKARRSFIVGGAAALTALGGWRWLRTRREVDGLAWPLRLSHEFNEELSRDYFSRARLTPTFPHEMATEPRVNGLEGLETEFDPGKWKLAIFGLANPPETSDETSSSATSTTSGTKSTASDASSSDENVVTSDEADEADSGDSATSNTPDLMLTLNDIKQLPRAEMVTQLKCIEGWSVIVDWAGARLADLIAKYPPVTRSGDSPDLLSRPDDLVGYVSLETPDGGYYVGLDMESALHPQTLLCYEMNGQPLTLKHGAPLRLVIPVKYGIKNIKRIGKITYTDKRPADYWAERGYDWYSGH